MANNPQWNEQNILQAVMDHFILSWPLHGAPTSSHSRKVTSSFMKWNFHSHVHHPHSEAQSRISNCPKYTKQLARIQLCSSQCINLNYRPDPHTKYCGLIVYDKQPRHLLGWGTMGSYTSMELQSFAIAKIFYKIWIQMRLWPSVKFYLTKTLDLTFF